MVVFLLLRNSGCGISEHAVDFIVPGSVDGKVYCIIVPVVDRCTLLVGKRTDNVVEYVAI